MGYMGLGMQKWIYTMKPRKPFSMHRKGSFSEIPKYTREFRIQDADRDYTDSIFCILPLLVLMILILIIKPRYMSYANEIHKTQVSVEKLQNEKAFIFLMQSGRDRLQKNNYKGAYSEFKLAHKIKPNHKGINIILFETLSILCDQDTSFCEELDSFQM